VDLFFSFLSRFLVYGFCLTIVLFSRRVSPLPCPPRRACITFLGYRTGYSFSNLWLCRLTMGLVLHTWFIACRLCLKKIEYLLLLLCTTLATHCLLKKHLKASFRLYYKRYSFKSTYSVTSMHHENPVENILQLQLSSDALAVLYLPSILSILSPVHFSSDVKANSTDGTGLGVSQVAPITPAMLNKWCTRVLSLMQSKDAGARWAGICLAKKTGELRRDVVVEYAQRWINLTLPSLSVRVFLYYLIGYWPRFCVVEDGTTARLESVHWFIGVRIRGYKPPLRV